MRPIHRPTRHSGIGALALALAAVLQPALARTGDDPAPPAVESGPTAGETLLLRGVTVRGAGEHADKGITAQHVKDAANDAAARIIGPLPAQASLAQLEAIAEEITGLYRQAGFVVAYAYLPPQDISQTGIARIEVLEGSIGRILTHGSQRYREDQIAASSLSLIGKPLHLRELERALLYARDLPGVTLSPVLRPGLNPGETDVLLQAEDNARPYGVRVGVNNHGTDATGRYRVEAGIAAYNVLGASDTLSANLAYGVDPADSWQAAVALNLPFAHTPGLSGVFGLSRSELELNTGPMAALEIHGPTTIGYAGLDWTFAQSAGLTASASARWIHEQSRLDGLGMELSRHKFDVLETGVRLRHTDRRLRGINVAEATVRKSINDESPGFNWLYPAHASHFLVSKLSLARLQALPGNQRVLLRGSAQFTEDALVPLEQFSLGGPDSVRAFPLSSALGDRGVLASFEYQVDAPGFADRASPLEGGTWRDLLTFSLFYDWGRVSPADDNRRRGALPIALEGAGVGIGLRLPWQPDMRLDLTAARPTARHRAFDDDGTQIWARLGMTF
ncbi:ShlB/FhaC/HecB family hemolysin secretion/activation protein [Luteimonas sp. TWI1416]|uniref:ShlB/FhaC/HecB family hemolysin secretion/activation protein n=1 Tax=unclassified Luteimonas TaxID=2629088 RepID=UPI003209247B